MVRRLVEDKRAERREVRERPERHRMVRGRSREEDAAVRRTREGGDAGGVWLGRAQAQRGGELPARFHALSLRGGVGEVGEELRRRQLGQPPQLHSPVVKPQKDRLGAAQRGACHAALLHLEGTQRHEFVAARVPHLHVALMTGRHEQRRQARIGS